MRDLYLHIFFFFFFLPYHFFLHRLENRRIYQLLTSLYQLLTMVGAGGIQTCVHPHVSRPLYHCATYIHIYLPTYLSATAAILIVWKQKNMYWLFATSVFVGLSSYIKLSFTALWSDAFGAQRAPPHSYPIPQDCSIKWLLLFCSNGVISPFQMHVSASNLREL